MKDGGQPVSRKGWTIVAGCVLIVAALVCVPVEFRRTSHGSTHVDFPSSVGASKGCINISSRYLSLLERLSELGQQTQTNFNDARMYFSVSAYFRDSLGGGTVAGDPWYTDSRTLVVSNIWGRNIEVERRGQRLVVNGWQYDSGQKCHRFKVWPIVGMWVLPSAELHLKNEGVFHCLRLPDGRELPADVLFVTGELRTSWMPNPLGLMVLFSGVWMVLHGAGIPLQWKTASLPKKVIAIFSAFSFFQVYVIVFLTSASTFLLPLAFPFFFLLIDSKQPQALRLALIYGLPHLFPQAMLVLTHLANRLSTMGSRRVAKLVVVLLVVATYAFAVWQSYVKLVH